MPPLLSGLSEVTDRYDGLILDLWGVLHDGAAPYPKAVATLQQLKAAGKRIAILSNAPRRAPHVVARITEIGIPTGLYDFIHSSGEEAWQHLRARDDAFYATLGRRCFFMGPPRDENLLEDVGVEKVDDIGKADFILDTGPWDWNDSVASFEPLLQEARARDLPMICANADLVVMHRARLMICAGAIAERYEAIGGRVRWHGKPHGSVYATCLTALGIADRRRILGVGDSLRTDIAGAAAAGIGSLFVAGGIHAAEFGMVDGSAPDPAPLAAAIRGSGQSPDYVIPRFSW